MCPSISKCQLSQEVKKQYIPSYIFESLLKLLVKTKVSGKIQSNKIVAERFLVPFIA